MLLIPQIELPDDTVQVARQGSEILERSNGLLRAPPVLAS